MSLREQQSKFAKMVMLLLQYIHFCEYEVTFGHAYRCNDCKVGIRKSKHKRRLAIDINLFKDGKFLQDTHDHERFGIFWESIGGTWGGRFNDGNHYEYDSKKITGVDD